jgi:branched-subunit amino acid transport protein
VEERRWSWLFGVPAMLAVAVVIAAIKLTHSILAVIVGGVGVLVLFLAIGMAMAIAKRG